MPNSHSSNQLDMENLKIDTSMCECEFEGETISVWLDTRVGIIANALINTYASRIMRFDSLKYEKVKTTFYKNRSWCYYEYICSRKKKNR